MLAALLELTDLPTLCRSSWQRGVQDTFCNSPGVKVCFGNVAGCPAVALIIGIYGIQCADCFVKCGETKHPFATRQKGTRTRILDHHWFAARQVADGSVADPSILKLHIGGFGAAELAARTLDILLVKFRCRRDLAGSADAPAAFLQFRLIRHVVVGAQEQRQLQRLDCALWQVRKFQKCLAFCVCIHSIAVDDPIGRFPDGYRGERLAVPVEHVRPALQTYWWTNVNPIETAEIGN